MKKYLIKGLLALIVGGFVASCADDKVDYIPVEQQKATAYAEAFKELIGGEVAPDHDWGFTKTSLIEEPASTRNAETNSNEWFTGTNPAYAGLVKPADVTDREEEVVTQWFKDNRWPQSDPISLSTFFVQQVHFGDKVYTSTGNNGTEYSVVGGVQMDWLCAYSNTERSVTNYYPYTEVAVSVPGHDDHINNFNTTDPKRNDPLDQNGLHNMQLMMYSSTSRFGFSESYNTNPVREGDAVNPDNNRIYYNYVIKAIPVDGVWGYYVGFDYESHGDQGDFDPDGWYDDRIVKIVPGDGIYTYNPGSSSSSSTTTRVDRVERRRLVDQGRIFCEDLGTNTVTTSDIDFNDAVFDAKIWRLGQYDVTYVNGNYSSETDYLTEIYPNGLENGKFKYIAEIRLLAAGGTIPLKIGGDKGFEIHSKFGEGNGRNIGHTTIINTMGAPSQANFTTTVNTETCEAVTVEVDITSLVAGQTEIGLDIIPIEVQWTSGNKNTVGEISADYGKVPQKLCVPIGTPWIYERIPITSAYKSFDSYARTKSPLFWDGTKDESLLYPSNPVGMTAETGLTGNVNTNPYYDKVVIPGDPTTTTVDKIDLWLGNKAFDNNTQGSNELLFSKDIVTNDVLRVYGSNGDSGNPFLEIALILNDQNWSWDDRLIRDNVDFSNGYININVTQNIKDMTNIRDYFGIWGQNVTITRIERIRTTVTH